MKKLFNSEERLDAKLFPEANLELANKRVTKITNINELYEGDEEYSSKIIQEYDNEGYIKSETTFVKDQFMKKVECEFFNGKLSREVFKNLDQDKNIHIFKELNYVYSGNNKTIAIVQEIGGKCQDYTMFIHDDKITIVKDVIIDDEIMYELVAEQFLDEKGRVIRSLNSHNEIKIEVEDIKEE